MESIFEFKNSIISIAIFDFAIDIRAKGPQSDGGVLNNSEMGRKFIANQMDFPDQAEIYSGGPRLR